MIYKTEQDVKRVIALAKPTNVIQDFWVSYQAGLQHKAWLDAQQVVYDNLYPATEAITKQDKNGDDYTEIVTLDYSETINYLPFFAWLQEREQIEVPAAEATEFEPAQDAYFVDGDLLREFTANPNNFANLAEDLNYIAHLKSQKLETIKTLKVTVTSGKEFDADEVSRQRMADAILSADFTTKTKTHWKLADNSVEEVTLIDLKEAHSLALMKLGEVLLG